MARDAEEAWVVTALHLGDEIPRNRGHTVMRHSETTKKIDMPKELLEEQSQ